MKILLLPLSKRLAIMVLLAVMPALVLLVYSGLENRQRSIETAENEMIQLSHTIAESQRQLADSTKQLLSSLSQLPDIQQAEAEKCNEIFASVVAMNPIYHNISLSGLDGYMIASAKPLAKVNFSDRLHIKRGFEQRTFAAGEYIKARLGDAIPSFPFSYPVYDHSSNMIGILSAVLDLSKFAKFHDSLDLPDKSFIAITDYKGVRIFYYPDQKSTNPVGKPINSASWERAQGATRMGFFKNEGSDGHRRIFAFEPVSLTPGEPPYAFAWAGIPEEYVLAPVNEKTTRNLVLMLIAALISIVMAWMIGKKTEELISSLKAAEASLEIERDKADAANRAKSDFLATMSHEIRTPLNAIINSAYLLNYSDLNAGQKSDIETILVSGKSLLALVNDSLDFAKIEAGEMNINPHPFSLAELLDDLRVQFVPACREKQLQLTIEAPAAEFPPLLIGDSNRLRQMLLNLLGNAIKFTDQGQIGLQLSQSRADENSVHIRFRVSDSGIGMSEDELARLFTPYTQASSGTARKYGGTGLGLSIVKTLTELMNGEVGVESTPGQGSSFWIEIPLAIAQLPQEDLSLAATENDKPLQGLHVLCVDDSLINLKVLARILSLKGVSCEQFINAEDALDRLKTTPEDFALILMDVQMPEMTGHEATTYIRQKMALSLPIIALTGGVTQLEQQRALDSGMNDFLAKPIDPKTLEEMLLKWCC